MANEVKRRVRQAKKDAQLRADDAISRWLDVSDVEASLQEEDRPPEMLVEDCLQRGILHWVQGEPEDGKSWIVLWWIVQLLRSDKRATALLMDGEMGRRQVGARLRALGLTPMEARRVQHVNLSVLPPEAFDSFARWSAIRRFTVAVWDPIAHHLAGAGYDENSNRDVQEWIAKVLNPQLRAGTTVVGIDHVVKSGESKGYARGASAKKARARVVLEFGKGKRFDRQTLGHTMITVVKNSDSAEIPRRRKVTLGGRTDGGFSIDVAEDDTAHADQRQATRRRMIQDAVGVLADAGEMAETSLAKELHGKEATIKAALRENADSPGGVLHRRVVRKGQRAYAYYSVREDNGVRLS